MKGLYKECIPHAEKAIALSTAPKENHYRLLLFCYSKLKDYEQVASLAERMIGQFGAKDEYLKSLAEAHRALGEEEDAFLIDAQRYELGFLKTEEDILRLAEGYLARKNPHRAARLLEKEMKAGRVKRGRVNLEKLGNMWFLAREYEEACTYLEAAARFAPPDTDDCDPRWCDFYFDEENWEKAEQQLRRSLKEGRLKSPCSAHTLLGHVLYNQERTDEAIEEFKLAAMHKECRREAMQWIEYLTEVERRNRNGGRRGLTKK